MCSYKGTLAKFIVNCFDADAQVCDNFDVLLHENQVERLILRKSRISGPKSYFWKQVVTPEIVKNFDFIWILDSDLYFDLTQYPVDKILSIGKSLNSSIINPTITDRDGMKEYTYQNEIPKLQYCCRAEFRGSIFSSQAYSLLYQYGLSKVDEDTLLHFSWSVSSYACDLVTHWNLNPCMQLHSYPLFQREPMMLVGRSFPGDRIWDTLRTTQNISHVCLKKKESIHLLKKWMNEHDELKRPIPLYNLGIYEDHGLPSSYHSLMKFKDRAKEIYNLHRQQNISIVNALQKKWDGVILYRDIDPYDLFLELGKVVDITDNSLLSTSQYFHGLQAYYNMKANNVTDQRALFLGLFHDIGKVLSLFGEKPENVVCSTFAVQEPKDSSEFCTKPKSHSPLITSWNHDTIAATRLAPYLSKDLLFVLQYHSFSPLLRGDIHCQLNPEEKGFLPLLRTLWRYDHLFKDIYTVEPSLLAHAKRDEEEIRSIFYHFLPRKINF
jgi:inositol oxygenase